MQGNDKAKRNEKLKSTIKRWLGITVLIIIASYFLVLILFALLEFFFPQRGLPVLGILGRDLSWEYECQDRQKRLKELIEEYRQQYGFYPSEAEWDDLYRNPGFWQFSLSKFEIGDTNNPLSLKECPVLCIDRETGNAYSYEYEYKSDSVAGSILVANEHGTGYSKYELRCTYDDSHNLETEDEKAN